jgi:hypothetical protein
VLGTANTAAPVLSPARRGDTDLHRRRIRVAPVACFIGFTALVFLALSAAAPSTAQAKIPILGEVPVVGEVAEGIGSVGKALLNPAEAVLSALLKVLQAIFGGVEAKLIAGVINGLLAVPNFNSGNVAALEHTTVAIAAGMLSAVLTLSIVRYYVVGLTDGGSGGFEALQGITRVLGAVSFIILWGGIFNELTQIPKMFDGALLGSASVQHNVALLFDAALVVGGTTFALNGGLGLIFVILIGFISAIVFIALLWMKVLLSVMMMFLFVSMPLCVALWPLPELGWLAASAMKAMFVGLLVPCVWAILFALSAAVSADVLTWAPSHSILDTVIIRPLAGITLMILCITLPRSLMKAAMIGPGGQAGGWKVWRTVTFGMFAMRGAAGAGRAVAGAAAEGHPAAKRMIDALPTPISPPSKAGEGNLASRMVFGRSGFAEEKKDGSGAKDKNEAPLKPKETTGAATTTGAGAGEQPQADAAPDPKVQAAQGTSDAIRRQEAGFSVPGIERPAYDRAAIDQAWQGMHARSQMSPPTAKAVASAMREFPAETQRGIAAYQKANPTRMRQWAAQHVGAAGLSDSQRSALLTIGSAPKAALEKGVGQAISTVDARTAPLAPKSAASNGSTGEPVEPKQAKNATGTAGRPTSPAASVPEQPAKTSGASAGAARPAGERQPPASGGAPGGIGDLAEQPVRGSGSAPAPDLNPFLDD